jgi:hypothetical protein
MRTQRHIHELDSKLPSNDTRKTTRAIPYSFVDPTSRVGGVVSSHYGNGQTEKLGPLSGRGRAARLWTVHFRRLIFFIASGQI